MCGPCSISSRDCVYADDGPPPRPPPAPSASVVSASASAPTRTSGTPAGLGSVVRPVAGSGTPTDLPALSLQTRSPEARIASSRCESPALLNNHSHIGSLISPRISAYGSPVLPPLSSGPLASGAGINPYQPAWGNSPETVTSELLSADLASTRWLDLLTTDAAQADGAFSLTITPAPAPSPAPEGESQASNALSDPQAAMSRAAAESEAVANEKHSWQLSDDIVLSHHETILFRTFAEKAALWVSLRCPAVCLMATVRLISLP